MKEKIKDHIFRCKIKLWLIILMVVEYFILGIYIGYIIK